MLVKEKRDRRVCLRCSKQTGLTQFFHDFYNLDFTLGKRVSEEVVRANWNVAAGASATGTEACVPTWLTDFRKDLAQFKVPTLVMHGDADRVLPILATATRTGVLLEMALIRLSRLDDLVSLTQLAQMLQGGDGVTAPQPTSAGLRAAVGRQVLDVLACKRRLLA